MHAASVKRLGYIGKSHIWIASQSWSLIQRSLAAGSLGVCEARVKLVELPWPEWHAEQPNFSDGCLLLAPTNRSSRGWAAYSVMRASVSRFFDRRFSCNFTGSATAWASAKPASDALRLMRMSRAVFSFSSCFEVVSIKLRKFSLVYAGRSMLIWHDMQRSKRVTYLKL